MENLFNLFDLALFSVTLLFVIRTILIISGNLKGPVLRHFETYGPDEFFYQPLPAFLGWFGAFLLSLGFLVNSDFAFMPLALLFWSIGLIIWLQPELSIRFSSVLLRYPLWLHELKQRTGRYERRRLAYMWLRLPRRLRSTYNANNNAFREWADFVILGTLH